ncbi:MAG: SDR family NAD(P)-dependent oxidoreductase [Gammaproteobacteria bacterium]
MTKRTALITGGAARIGAAIARELHGRGIDIVIHYRHSGEAAAALVDELNAGRPGSAATVKGDLLDHDTIPHIIDKVAAIYYEVQTSLLTTGATADAMARALRAAGASAVDVWCLARTPPPGD